MVSGKNFGDYIPETDTITIERSYKSVKEFLMTVLHEIQHLDADNLGKRKFIKKYNQAGTMAAHGGLDPHDDNKWEEKAERFAEKEIKKYLNNKKLTLYILLMLTFNLVYKKIMIGFLIKYFS